MYPACGSRHSSPQAVERIDPTSNIKYLTTTKTDQD